MERYPFKPGDWVQDGGDRVAKVKSVWDQNGEVLLDLVMFSHTGEREGRTSPAMGGPRTFEPACDAAGWERITPPVFPMVPKWVTNPDGSRTARMWGGDRLPPANWKPPVRKGRVVALSPDDRLVLALRAIAEGHNDPRTLAISVLQGMK